MARSDPNIVVLRSSHAGLRRSTDGGKSWSSANGALAAWEEVARSLDLEGALQELLDVCVEKFPDLKPESLLKGLLAPMERKNGWPPATARRVGSRASRPGYAGVRLRHATTAAARTGRSKPDR